MSFKVKKILLNSLLIVFCFTNIISLASGGCEVNIPEDISLRPNFFLKIGSHKVEIIPRKRDTYVSFFKNQEIEVQCKTKFASDAWWNRGENIIKAKCEDNQLYIFGNNFNQILIECSPQKWNLYETSKNFAWCPSNVTSYLLGRQKVLAKTKLQYLAGICYDTTNLSFKSLYYTLAPQHTEYLPPPTLANGYYSPSLEVNYFKETFGEKSINETSYDNQDVQDWMKYAKYNYSSVIQNSLLFTEFTDQLGSILDVAWWPNLRLGNWKRYETALIKQVESQNQSYNILSGISSFAKVPIIESCKTNYTLKEIINNRNQKIPLYVWSYLQSTSNNSDEIVIIGVNSPFYQFYAEADIVFCTDKCQEIPWLKKFSSTFRYSALGVIFCCSSEDVKSSKRLDGFREPNNNSQNSLETFTVEPLLFTKVEYTTVEDTTVEDMNNERDEYE